MIQFRIKMYSGKMNKAFSIFKFLACLKFRDKKLEFLDIMMF